MIEEYNNINQKSFPPCIACSEHTNVKLIIDSDEIEISCPKCNMLFKAPSSSYKHQLEGFHRNKQYCERDKSHSSIKGSYYCSSCSDYFCKDCAEDHKKKLTKSIHNIISLDDYRATKCKVHHEKATFYCITCKDYFCDSCTNEHSSHNIIKIDELNTHYNFIKTDYYNFKKEYKKYLTDLYNNTIRKLKELIQKLSEEYKNNLKRSEEIFNLIDLIVDSYDISYPNYQDLYNVLLNSHLSFTSFEDYKSKNSNNNIFESMLSYFSSNIPFLYPFEQNNFKTVLFSDGFLTHSISFHESIFLCLLRDESELVYFDKRNYELCVYSFKEGSLSSKLKTNFNDIRSVSKVSDDLVLITNSSGIFLIQIQDSIKIILLQSGDIYHQIISLNDNKFASISSNYQGSYFIQLFQTESSFTPLFQNNNIFSKESETKSLLSSEQKTDNLLPVSQPQAVSLFCGNRQNKNPFFAPRSNEIALNNSETRRSPTTSKPESKISSVNLLKRIEEVSIFILGTKDNKYIGSITSNEIHFWNIKSYSCDGVIKNIECDNKSTMIEIEDNRLIIQGQSSLYIISYHTFQIETILLIIYNSPPIRSMSILNCKDIIIFTENAYLIRISSKTFTQIKKSFHSPETGNLNSNNIFQQNFGVFGGVTQRKMVCSSLPSMIEIYSTLNIIQQGSIKKIQL